MCVFTCVCTRFIFTLYFLFVSVVLVDELLSCGRWNIMPKKWRRDPPPPHLVLVHMVIQTYYLTIIYHIDLIAHARHSASGQGSGGMRITCCVGLCGIVGGCGGDGFGVSTSGSLMLQFDDRRACV